MNGDRNGDSGSGSGRDHHTTPDLPRPLQAPPAEQGVTGELRTDRQIGTTELTHWYSPLGRQTVRLADQVNRRLGPNATLIVTLVIGLAIAVGLSALAVQVYDAVTDADGVAGFDHPLLDFAMTLRSPWFDAIATGYTDIAGPIGMPIVAVAALLLLGIRRRSWTPVILIVAAGGGSLLMTIAGKNFIGRVRPPLVDAVPPYEYSPSFPSGHTLNAVVVAGVIAYLLILRQERARSRVLIISAAVFFALTVGLSRVFLGHHWFTDVLAGWILGVAWLAIVITAHRIYLTVRESHERARALTG